MPRAEIPEEIERLELMRAEGEVGLYPIPDGDFLRVRDFPAIKAHWLEQLKERLLSDEVIDAVASRHLPGGTTVHALLVERLKTQARDDIRTALDSIALPDEEGENDD